VVRHRDRRHFHFGRFLHQLLHPHRAIEERIFSVEMEMNEGISRHFASVYELEVAAQSRVIFVPLFFHQYAVLRRAGSSLIDELTPLPKRSVESTALAQLGGVLHCATLSL
jgi:hypothetical protein